MELERHTAAFHRYRIGPEVARGGMGAILSVWDCTLRRRLAMKIALARDAGVNPAAGEKSDASRSLSRFLEEAQVTGQLDHPGIVPVHELGLSPDGDLYFTMRLVKGRDLLSVFEMARLGTEGWNQTRVLGVILKVCEAMAFAHKKGVIHRDLKPANVMVGRFGETYVMDWGLSRVLGEADTKDIRPRGAPPGSGSRVVSDRRHSVDRRPDSPLITMDGDVIGTPAYMSPEQARGERDAIGPASDVYSVGAILYHLLAGHMPYVLPGTPAHPHGIWHSVLLAPPTPLFRIDRRLQPELVAICERAMARRIDERYAGMTEVADDLRAYLENRVVRAYRTGAVAELRMWVRRNRAAASLVGALLLSFVAAGFVIAGIENRRHEEAVRFLDEKLASAAVAEENDLWPVHPDRVPAMDRWLEAARELVAKKGAYEADLAMIRNKALPYTDEMRKRDRADGALRIELDHACYLRDGMRKLLAGYRRDSESSGGDGASRAEVARCIGILELELPHVEEKTLDLAAEIERRKTWLFDDPELVRRHERVARLVAELEALAAPGTGAISRVAERRERAANLARDTIVRYETEWREAIASIRDRDECPAYAGLEIEPQLGLVPLRRDPASRLYEFWLPLSGEKPKEGANGDLAIEAETAVVLVLVPAGTFQMGAQAETSDEVGFDPAASKSERPVHPVSLPAYFISKYELTQAQWLRAGGGRPSENFPGLRPKNSVTLSQTHPVEHVTFDECARVLARWNLEIPTEAQWERAARGGTSSPYFSGAGAASVRGAANLADAATGDGYPLHSPVDAFSPNPFGLFGVMGNVWEWCRDWFCLTYQPAESGLSEWDVNLARIDANTGEHVPIYSNAKAIRGGSYMSRPESARVSSREKRMPNALSEDIGVRPALRLDE